MPDFPIIDTSRSPCGANIKLPKSQKFRKFESLTLFLEERTVGQTFYFLTATWLAAQGADPSTIWNRDVSSCGCQRTYSDNYVHAVGNWETSSGCGCNQGFSGGYNQGFSGGYQERQGILARIQSRLNGFTNYLPFRHQIEEGEIYQGEGAIVQSASPGRPMPSSARSGEPPLADVANQPAPRSPISTTDFHPAPPVSHGLLIEPEPK
jgi:hypothetical protein